MQPEIKEAMQAISPVIAAVTDAHEANQRLWLPSELIPIEHKTPDLPPELTGLLTLNLLTEDGLPYFMALLVKHLGDEGPIWDWNRLWTAEEDRHGQVIKLYLYRALSHEERIAVERLQYNYLRSGFWPDWANDPYQLLAYVVLQEQATWLSHAGIAKRAAAVDPVLQSIMAKVSGEEVKHYQAYLKMFQALMAINPSHAVVSIEKVVSSFKMPGKGIDGFAELAKLQERLRVFGGIEFSQLVSKLWDTLNLGRINGLNEDGEIARDKLAKLMSVLERIAKRAADAKQETIALAFLKTTVTA